MTGDFVNDIILKSRYAFGLIRFGEIGMNVTLKRPGGEISARPLHFIWIVDVSGSMSGEKIGALNFGIREAIPAMVSVAEENPNARILVRTLKFGEGAQWHHSQPTEVKDFRWNDLQATDNGTCMGKAMEELAKVLKMPPMEERSIPPVLVLLSDGQPTDDFSKGLKTLMNEPWAKKAVRIAISIGEDADGECLQKFIGHSEIKPIEVRNAPSLVESIRWVSTIVLKSASSPNSQAPGTAQTGTPIPTPPQPSDDQSGWVF